MTELLPQFNRLPPSEIMTAVQLWEESHPGMAVVYDGDAGCFRGVVRQ